MARCLRRRARLGSPFVSTGHPLEGSSLCQVKIWSIPLVI